MDTIINLLHNPLFSASLGATITGMALIINHFVAKYTKPNLVFSISLFGGGVAMMTILSMH